MEAMADWRDIVFVISTSYGDSEKMLELCGMFLLPRTDLAPERVNVFCDKIDDHSADMPLTHMSFSEGQGMWILEQRATPFGQDEILATMPCTKRYPEATDRWNLVHRSFGGKGSLQVTRWTMQDYMRKMKYMPTSDTGALSRVKKLSRELKEVMYMA